MGNREGARRQLTAPFVGHFIGQDLAGCPQEWRTEVVCFSGDQGGPRSARRISTVEIGACHVVVEPPRHEVDHIALHESDNPRELLNLVDSRVSQYDSTRTYWMSVAR